MTSIFYHTIHNKLVYHYILISNTYAWSLLINELTPFFDDLRSVWSSFGDKKSTGGSYGDIVEAPDRVDEMLFRLWPMLYGEKGALLSNSGVVICNESMPDIIVIKKRKKRVIKQLPHKVY